MSALSTLSSNTAKIESIESFDNVSVELIDIEVENQHTFWVSDGEKRWVLTHNCGIPDIDTDVSDRDKVLDVMRAEFGNNNVVPISNYNVLKVKSLLKDLSKFYGIPFEEANAATLTVEREVRSAVTKHGDDKNLFVLTFEDAMSYHCIHAKEKDAKPICTGCTPSCTKQVSPSFRSFMDAHPEVAKSMKVLFKQNRSLGRHAGGVLVCDDLPSKMPLVVSKGEPQTPWQEGVSVKHLEKIGNFIKYDLLGLETLRLIERSIQLILAKQRKERGWYEFELDDGTTRTAYGDETIETARGPVLARDLRSGDDIVSS